MDQIKTKITKEEGEILEAKNIRRKVFQEEQGIKSELDYDGKDEDADHFVAYFNDKIVGTLRVRYLSKDTAKLERLAILKDYRKAGIGTKLLNFVINYLKDKMIKKLKLNAQLSAREFYQKNGFEEIGEPFDELGIMHIKMTKILNGN